MRAVASIASLSTFVVACGGLGPSKPDPASSASAEPDVGVDHEGWARREGLTLQRFDLNRDGKADVFKYFRPGDGGTGGTGRSERLERKEIDINHDTRLDVIQLFDESGRLREERLDLDFDGRFDEVVIYADGVLDHKQVDLDFDGRPDVFKYYEGDRLVRIEADRSLDGRIDTWEYYEGGELDRIGFDTDLDGRADKWERRQKPEPQAAEGGSGPETGAPAPPVGAGAVTGDDEDRGAAADEAAGAPLPSTP